jgi:hypothetical protein
MEPEYVVSLVDAAPAAADPAHAVPVDSAPADAVPMDAVEAAAKEAALVRRARFGTLPERIPASEMIEELRATPKGGDGYDEDRAWMHYSAATFLLFI